MKKIILFAAACAAFASCNKIENCTPVFKAGEIITLKAGVAIPQTKVQPVNPSEETVTFKWEETDTVTISNATGTSKFIVVPGSINGGNAEFTGAALSDMSSYNVYYNYEGDTSKVHSVNYMPGSFKPFINGTGTATGFVMNEFMPVLSIRLFNSNSLPLTAGRICYYTGVATEESTSATSHHSRPLRTELIFKDGLELSATDTVQVYFPISCVSNPSGFTIDFFDANGEMFDVDPDNAWTDYRYMAPEVNLSNCMNKIVSFNKPLAAYCLAAGTLVTMADGSVRKIEDVAVGDRVMTFDHEKGALSSSEICLAYKGDKKIRSFVLSFSSGKKLSIVGTHDLLEESSLKYVQVNSANASKYVGKRFYNAELAGWDTLTGCEQGKPTEFYCLYSAYHINCIAEGLLTCPDDVDFCLNIYELDGNLKADAACLAADIDVYGLYDLKIKHPEYASDSALSYIDKIFRNVEIAIGKGLVSREVLLSSLTDTASSH